MDRPPTEVLPISQPQRTIPAMHAHVIDIELDPADFARFPCLTDEARDVRVLDVDQFQPNVWIRVRRLRGCGGGGSVASHVVSGAAPNIPPKINRRWKPCFSPVLYRRRDAIERMFGRIKDFRRIATKYDRIATNFLAAVHLAATVSYWL